MCWELVAQQDETVVWKKTSLKKCYFARWADHTHISSFQFLSFPWPIFDQVVCNQWLSDVASIYRRPGVGPSLCSKGQDIESPYYRPLQACIAGTQSRRWIPIEERTKWPSRAKLNSSELKIHGNGLSLSSKVLNVEHFVACYYLVSSEHLMIVLVYL